MTCPGPNVGSWILNSDPKAAEAKVFITRVSCFSKMGRIPCVGGFTTWCHSGASEWIPRDGLGLSSLALQPILFILFRKSFNQSHRPLCRFQSPWYLMLLTTLLWQFLFLALSPFYLPVSSPATYNSPSLGAACQIPLQSLGVG